MTKTLLRSATVLVLALSLFSASSEAASSRVRFDKGRLSIHVERMPLGELFDALAEATGVQFILDEELAQTPVSLDFEGLPLVAGIKKVVSPLNHATIEDDSGKLAKVFVFGEGKDVMTLGDQREIEHPREIEEDEGERPTRRRSASFEEEEESVSTSPDEIILEEEPDDLEALVADNGAPPQSSTKIQRRYGANLPTDSGVQTFDGPPESDANDAEGPPQSAAESTEGPPQTQIQPSDGPPSSDMPDNPPPTGSSSGSMDGPPQD